MRSVIVLACVFGLGFLQGCNRASSSSTDSSGDVRSSQRMPADSLPIDVVNRRMEMYNDHSIQAFLDLYSDDVEIFTYPDTSLGNGKDHIRRIFEPMFQEGTARVEIHGQFTRDSYVVNNETVQDGDTRTDYVSIYEVRNGLIQSVRFVRD